jgi:flagellum-specific ATP synthase
VCKSEVVAFREGKVLSIALGEVENISPSCNICATGKTLMIGVGNGLLGRVVDGFGIPMDGKGEIKYESYKNVYRRSTEKKYKSISRYNIQSYGNR